MAPQLIAIAPAKLHEMIALAVDFALRQRDLRPPHARHDVPTFETGKVIGLVDEKSAYVQLDRDAPGVAAVVALAVAVQPDQRVVVAMRPAGGAFVIGAAPAVAAPTQSIPPWTPYTPLWACSANPQPSIGNGVLQAAYFQLDKSVTIRGRLRIGSTTAAGGAGYWTFGLPVAPKLAPTGSPLLRQAFSAAISNAAASLIDGPAIAMIPNLKAAATTPLSQFVVIWGGGRIGPQILASTVGDELHFFGTYEAA